MNNLYSYVGCIYIHMYLERINNNNVNIYILYTCDFHAQNNIVFILCISILTFILSLLFIFNYKFFRFI